MSTIGLYSFPRSGANIVRSILHILLTPDVKPTWKSIGDSIPDHPTRDPLSGPAYETVAGPFSVFKSNAPLIVDRYRDRELDTKYYFYTYRHPLDVFCSTIDFLHMERDGLQWLFEVPLVSFEEHVSQGTLDDLFGVFLVVGHLAPGDYNPGSWWTSLGYWKAVKADFSESVNLLRYEDIVTDPVSALMPMAAFFGKTASQLRQAVSDAAGLAQRDRTPFSAHDVDKYKRRLPPHLIEKFRQIFADRLEGFGYSL